MIKSEEKEEVEREEICSFREITEREGCDMRVLEVERDRESEGWCGMWRACFVWRFCMDEGYWSRFATQMRVSLLILPRAFVDRFCTSHL